MSLAGQFRVSVMRWAGQFRVLVMTSKVGQVSGAIFEPLRIWYLKYLHALIFAGANISPQIRFVPPASQNPSPIYFLKAVQ